MYWNEDGANVTAGQQDYVERMNEIENQREAYYKQQGSTSGAPINWNGITEPEFHTLVESKHGGFRDCNGTD